MIDIKVDVTTLKDRSAYYAARADFLRNLLKGHLSVKQRRQAEKELMAASVKALSSQPHKGE